MRFGVNDLADQIEALGALGIPTGDPIVIADMVRVIDVYDPDGNDVAVRLAETTEYDGFRPNFVIFRSLGNSIGEA